MGIAAVLALALVTGCQVDSFFDPSRVGYFERYPTSIDVLDRIDVIEPPEDDWRRATPVQPEDLIPSELSYYLYPGDLVTISIFELYQTGLWSTTSRRIDAGGFYRVPEVGDVKAAGLTPQQFEDLLTRLIHEQIMENPQVDVVVEDSGGLRYTIGGAVGNPGMYTLRNPDLRLLDALAIAGGVPITTSVVYVVRTVPLTEEVMPSHDPRRTTPPDADRPPQEPVDIEDIIEQMENPPGRPDRPQNPDENPPPERPNSEPRLGMMVDLRQEPGQQPPPEPPPAPVDVDDLEPARVPQQPPIDVDVVRPDVDEGGDAFIYDAQRGEWVRVRREGAPVPGVTAAGQRPMVQQRIIEVPYDRLKLGDISLNVVIRPNDYIYAGEPVQGLVYMNGEVNRPGTYNLPLFGKLTLARAIAAAGGLGPIAVPSRVDLTRRIGHNREATITLDFAAIMQRHEPDVLLKPDDLITVGTTWWATPLAVIRNGLRATYGFGFLLDRNFGSDVFGAPEDGLIN